MEEKIDVAIVAEGDEDQEADLFYDDARKEFSAVSRIGFGVDASTDGNRRNDFEHVRGDFERDPFVRMVLDHIDTKSALHDDLISRLPK